jgi:hypothetical protein
MKWESDDVLKQFIKKDFPDFRSLINNIQIFSKMEIEEITQEHINKNIYVMEDLFKLLISSPDPLKNYKVIMSEYATKVSDAFLNIGTKFPEWLAENKPAYMTKLPQVIINAAKYEFQVHNGETYWLAHDLNKGGTLLTRHGPDDWACGAPKHYDYICQVKWLGDYTWIEVEK